MHPVVECNITSTTGRSWTHRAATFGDYLYLDYFTVPIAPAVTL